MPGHIDSMVTEQAPKNVYECSCILEDEVYVIVELVRVGSFIG